MDPYKAANIRLTNLLSGVGSGDDEMFDQILREEAPWTKVGFALGSGGLVAAGASLICFLCELAGQRADILGGATLTLDSLAAAAVGLVAGIPLAGLRAVIWGPDIRSRLSSVNKMVELEEEYYQPILAGMNDVQAAITLTSEVLPTLLILLPAAQYGLTFSYGVYCELTAQLVHAKDLDVTATSETLALLTTAALTAIGQLVNGSISEEQKQTVDDALENADRYYRLMWMQPGRTQEDAQDARRAFEYVARTYVDTWQEASRLSAMLAAGEVIYLGLLWRATGDLWAPFVAAMLPHMVDFYFVRKRMDTASA
ncbi:unnamed protein product [Pedinophyceae sp. YPF-701]|nr:unnamed protein product [Pedinophyceae sp. YPF-701]